MEIDKLDNTSLHLTKKENIITYRKRKTNFILIFYYYLFHELVYYFYTFLTSFFNFFIKTYFINLFFCYQVKTYFYYLVHNSCLAVAGAVAFHTKDQQKVTVWFFNSRGAATGVLLPKYPIGRCGQLTFLTFLNCPRSTAYIDGKLSRYPSAPNFLVTHALDQRQTRERRWKIAKSMHGRFRT